MTDFDYTPVKGTEPDNTSVEWTDLVHESIERTDLVHESIERTDFVSEPDVYFLENKSIVALEQKTMEKNSNEIGLPFQFRPPEACPSFADNISVSGIAFDMWAFGIISIEVFTGCKMHFYAKFKNSIKEDILPTLREILQEEYFVDYFMELYDDINIEQADQVLKFVYLFIQESPEKRAIANQVKNHKFFGCERKLVEVNPNLENDSPTENVNLENMNELQLNLNDVDLIFCTGDHNLDSQTKNFRESKLEENRLEQAAFEHGESTQEHISAKEVEKNHYHGRVSECIHNKSSNVKNAFNENAFKRKKRGINITIDQIITDYKNFDFIEMSKGDLMSPYHENSFDMTSKSSTSLLKQEKDGGPNNKKHSGAFLNVHRLGHLFKGRRKLKLEKTGIRLKKFFWDIFDPKNKKDYQRLLNDNNEYCQ